MSEDVRLFDHDAESGITEYMIFDNDTGNFVIQYQQDVEQIVESNKSLYNGTEKHTRYGEWTRIASVPNIVLMELAKKEIVSPTGVILDDKKYRDWLNDSSHEAFRTRRGKV